MEFNYQTQAINARMNLDEALKAYSDEVQFITLRDGTNIEIISDNQNFRSRPEASYTDNQLENYHQENIDEFVEENVVDNMNSINYQQMSQNSPVQLRGKGKKKVLGKSLRKTVLKSINGDENEKQFVNGKLRNLRADKPNLQLNEIIQFSEHNEYLQCANCHKFFVSEENEEDKNNEKNKTTVNEQQTQPQPQQFPQSQQPKFPAPQQFQPFPQPGHHHSKHNQHQQHNKNNINMNMNMGFNPMYNQPHQFSPQMPQNQKKHQQQIPHQKHQKGGFNQPQFFPGKMPMPNQQMPQFRGGGFNQVFRARKKEANEYEIENDDYGEYEEENNFDNYNTDNTYFYPASAKKYNSNKKIYPMQQKIAQMSNRGLTRNLSYGFKKSSNQQFGYPNMNFAEYGNENEIGYYEYPNYYQRNVIPNTRRVKKANNHSVVNVKVTRNVPYQYQEYEEYQDYVDYDM